MIPLVLFAPALALHHNQRCLADQARHWCRIRDDLHQAKRHKNRTLAFIRSELEQIDSLERRRVAWKTLLSEFRRNENVFENFAQVTLLALLSALSASDTRTVHEL